MYSLLSQVFFQFFHSTVVLGKHRCQRHLQICRDLTMFLTPLMSAEVHLPFFFI